MLNLLLAASLLNGLTSFTYNGPTILMIGADTGQFISWTSANFRTVQDCMEAAKEVAQLLEEARVPMQVEIYCTAAPHYA